MKSYPLVRNELSFADLHKSSSLQESEGLTTDICITVTLSDKVWHSISLMVEYSLTYI